MSSLFTRIIDGEIPCAKVWEDEDHFAFLDIRPWVEGHTLVVPKREVAYLFDLSEAEHAALWTAVRTVAARLKERLACERVCVAVMGWEVPHVHVHLLPTNGAEDWPPPRGTSAAAPESLAALATRLSARS